MYLETVGTRNAVQRESTTSLPSGHREEFRPGHEMVSRGLVCQGPCGSSYVLVQDPVDNKEGSRSTTRVKDRTVTHKCDDPTDSYNPDSSFLVGTHTHRSSDLISLCGSTHPYKENHFYYHPFLLRPTKLPRLSLLRVLS